MVGLPKTTFAPLWNEILRRTEPQSTTGQDDDCGDPDSSDCEILATNQYKWTQITTTCSRLSMKQREQKLGSLGLLESKGSGCDAIAFVTLRAAYDKGRRWNFLEVKVSQLLVRGPYAVPKLRAPLFKRATFQKAQEILAGIEIRGRAVPCPTIQNPPRISNTDKKKKKKKKKRRRQGQQKKSLIPAKCRLHVRVQETIKDSVDRDTSRLKLCSHLCRSDQVPSCSTLTC